MLKKILDSKLYRIIISIIEGLFLTNIGIMIYKAVFSVYTSDNWKHLLINVLIVCLIFIIDCIINACVGNMIYVKTRKEKGFQASRYCYISLIASCSYSVTVWVARSIQYIDINEYGIWTWLLVLVIITTTIFFMFFFMMLMFLINNKIVLANENYNPDENNNNNLLKIK